MKTKPKITGKFIESVTTTDRGVEVMFRNVRLIYDGISEVVESNFEGTTSYRFVAGLELPEGKELDGLIKTIRDFFQNLDLKGWSSKLALEHFDSKKFKSASDNAFRLLYPSAPAEQVEDGFQPKGRLFVKPGHDAFYAGCYVNAKVAFVANTRGTVVVKDYLNGIEFAADGEPITGLTDPFGGSESKGVVTGVKAAAPAPEKTKPAKKPVRK